MFTIPYGITRPLQMLTEHAVLELTSTAYFKTFPHTALLNKNVSIHLRGGVLDLSFVSMELLPLTNWTLHLYLTSDHFVSTISLNLPQI